MNKEEFIEELAKYVCKYAEQYNVKCPSAVIAQGCLESGYGTSYKAQFHNYFGLKYRPNRCKTAIGTFEDKSAEQNKNGSYSSIYCSWFRFKNLEDGVIGYFDFTNISSYAKCKNVEDPKKYLEEIKKVGYASSLDYVENVYKVIVDNNLTRFDKKTPEISEKISDKTEGFTNSSLVEYVKLSPNFSKRKNKKITKITIHHMAGNLSIETCGNVFASASRKASANYGIDSNGRVGMYVEECNRAWTSSNAENDHQAVTIEVANNSGAPKWTVSDKAYSKLIDLCVDICQRNDIKEINFTGDKNGNLTMHKYFAKTACPGPYLESKFPEIANKINERLGNKTNNQVKEDIPKNSEKLAENSLKIGDLVYLNTDAVIFGTNKKFSKFVYSKQLYIRSISGNRVVISTVKQGAVTGAVDIKYLKKV